MNLKFIMLSDRALGVYFGNSIDIKINEKVIHISKLIKEAELPGVLAIQHTYHQLVVHFEPQAFDLIAMKAFITEKVAGESLIRSIEKPIHIVKIPVYYDGPDLDRVASHCGLSVEEIIVKHSEAVYHTYFLGFSAGFPYLGGLNPQIEVPRLKEPRLRVEAGSVGIADQQTGIYTVTSPGGWNIIGHTPLKLFDSKRVKPCLIMPGDQVVFVPM